MNCSKIDFIFDLFTIFSFYPIYIGGVAPDRARGKSAAVVWRAIFTGKKRLPNGSLPANSALAPPPSRVLRVKGVYKTIIHDWARTFSDVKNFSSYRKKLN